MIQIACALIVDVEGRVLCAQRSETMRPALKWEFPGGKVEEDESPRDCVVREILEELELKIEVMGEGPSSQFALYPDQILLLLPFVCKIVGGQLRLQEHVDALWLLPHEMSSLDWAEADLPILSWWQSGGWSR